jgi:hypothetical protein
MDFIMMCITLIIRIFFCKIKFSNCLKWMILVRLETKGSSCIL